jgi:hypothetical protein
VKDDAGKKIVKMKGQRENKRNNQQNYLEYIHAIPIMPYPK